MSQDPATGHTPEYGGAPVPALSVADELNAPAQMSPLSRLANVFFSPGEVFNDVRRSPRDWWLPILALVILSGGIGYVVQARLDLTPEKMAAAAVDSGLQQQGKTRKDLNEQEANAVAMQEKFIGYAFKFGPIVGLIMLPIMVGIGSALFYVLLMIFQAKTTYFRIVCVMSYAYFVPNLVKALLTLIMSFLRRPEDVDPAAFITQGGLLSASPAALVTMNQHPVLWTFLSWLDVFGIWFLALLAIGFAAITVKRMKIGTATVVAITPYVLGMLGSTALKLLTSK